MKKFLIMVCCLALVMTQGSAWTYDGPEGK